MEFITGLFTNPEIGDWIAAVTGLVTSMTVITALTPSKADDKIANGLLGVLNFLAGNVFKNKNKDA